MNEQPQLDVDKIYKIFDFSVSMVVNVRAALEICVVKTSWAILLKLIILKNLKYLPWF
jgi:hypothetical protein